MAKLGDYADFIMGQAPASSDCNNDGRGTPFVKAGQFGVSKPVVDEWTTNPLKMADDTDILICVVGATSGKLNRGIKCAIGRSVAAIRPHENVVRDYIYYGLHPWIQRLRGGSQGSAIGVITKDMLDSVDMAFPATAKQEEIVQTLSLLEDIIDKRKQEIEKFDQLIKARFVELFGNGKYPIEKLGKVCTKITDGTHKTPNYLDEGVTFISAKNIINGELDFSDVKYISEEEFQEIQKRCQTEKLDILLSKSGSLGSPAIVRTDEKLGLFESLAVLKYDRTRIVPEFLCEQLRTEKVQRQFTTGTKGVAIKHLHLGVISDTDIIIPSMEEQEAFADFVKQVDKSKVAVQKALDETQTLFDSLMQEYFG